jgi:hypothetical protein
MHLYSESCVVNNESLRLGNLTKLIGAEFHMGGLIKKGSLPRIPVVPSAQCLQPEEAGRFSHQSTGTACACPNPVSVGLFRVALRSGQNRYRVVFDRHGLESRRVFAGRPLWQRRTHLLRKLEASHRAPDVPPCPIFSKSDRERVRNGTSTRGLLPRAPRRQAVESLVVRPRMRKSRSTDGSACEHGNLAGAGLFRFDANCVPNQEFMVLMIGSGLA